MTTATGRVVDASGNAGTKTATFTVTTTAAPRLLMGASTSSDTTWAPLDAATGPLQCRRTYSGAVPAAMSSSPAKSDPAARRASYWSIKPNCATFPTDAAAQAVLKKCLSTNPAGHPLTVTVWHEPEQELAAGQYTMAAWKATVNKVGEIVDSLARPEIRTAICIMGPWTFDTLSAYSKWDWDSGLNWSVIDAVGIDPYRWKLKDPSLEKILTVNNSGRGDGGTALSTMARLTKWGKPVVLSEWGCSQTGITLEDKAAWITAAYTWMKRWNATHDVARFEAAIYFNNNLDLPKNPQSTWELSGAPLAALKAAVADARVA